MGTGNFDNIEGHSAIISKFFPFYRIFHDNLDKNLGTFENLHL